MNLYFDTSAFLKLILQEPGSTTAERAARAATHMLAVTVLLAEAGAALAAASRDGRLRPAAYATAKRSLQILWSPVLPVVPDVALARQAGGVAGREGLRGYDAVHLAAALQVQADAFVCADVRLIQAARNFGLQVIDTRL